MSLSAGLAVWSGQALADDRGNPWHGGGPGHGGHHTAPAPLLGAGIPVFAALGGGAFLSRLRRRRKTETQTVIASQASSDS